MILICIISPSEPDRWESLYYHTYLLLANVLTFDSLQMFLCNICIIFHHFSGERNDQLLMQKKKKPIIS